MEVENQDQFQNDDENQQSSAKFIPMGLFILTIVRSRVHRPELATQPLTEVELKYVSRRVKGVFTRFRHRNKNKIAMRMLITKPFIGVQRLWHIQVFVTLQSCEEQLPDGNECQCIQTLFMMKLRNVFKLRKSRQGFRIIFNQYFDRDAYKRYKFACFKDYYHYYEFVDSDMAQCPYNLRNRK